MLRTVAAKKSNVENIKLAKMNCFVAQAIASNELINGQLNAFISLITTISAISSHITDIVKNNRRSDRAAYVLLKATKRWRWHTTLYVCIQYFNVLSS